MFHSIRKTVITMLENAGVSENVAADIVGHEKPRIAYGPYSGGAVDPTGEVQMGYPGLTRLCTFWVLPPEPGEGMLILSSSPETLTGRVDTSPS